MSETLSLHVTGMTCGGCENAVKKSLMKIDGVESVDASHTRESVAVVYRAGSVTPAQITSAIDALGYTVNLE